MASKRWDIVEDASYQIEELGNVTISGNQEPHRMTWLEHDGDIVRLPIGMAVCQLVNDNTPVQSRSIGLDAPDGPGWWAFEGKYIGNSVGTFRDCFELILAKPKNGAEQLYVIVDNDYESIDQFDGKWTRLHLPWESQQSTEWEIVPDGAYIIGKTGGILYIHRNVSPDSRTLISLGDETVLLDWDMIIMRRVDNGANDAL